jgi:hypothetical protein
VADFAQVNTRLKQIFSKYKDAEVRAGYLSGASYDNGKTLARVAIKHENGLGVPLRPFMTKARDDNNAKWKDGLKRALAAGVPLDKALALTGEKMVGDIKKSIVYGSWKSNSPATIARKGFDRPLVDTGAMLRSAEYEVLIGGMAVRTAYSAANPEPKRKRRGSKR